jgi:hypothetical protein
VHQLNVGSLRASARESATVLSTMAVVQHTRVPRAQ